jgi:ribosomal protein S18 acetylase RimI-like enzyme
MGPEVPLRIAGPADVSTVTGLIGEFRDFLNGDSPSNAQIESVVSELIGDPSTEYLLIGDPEQGFAQVRYRLSVWQSGEDAWLEDVFVRESARGNGYGRTLVAAAIERARSRGCGRIQLEANRNNEAAVSLYESVGFEASHLPDYWGDAPDVCFTRRL